MLRLAVTVELELLGPLGVRLNGKEVELPGRASQSVLVALALRAGRWVASDRLVEDVWGEAAPKSSRKALQMHVSRLRRAFSAASGDAAGLIDSGPGGYRLVVAPDEIDAARFERLVDEARLAEEASEMEQARHLLTQALALWRGPAPAFSGGLRDEMARLEELRLVAWEHRIDLDVHAGRHERSIAELRQLVVENPWRERLHGLLMLALYRAGRQAEALEAYRRARRLLIDELGIEPGPELRDLQAAILAHDPALARPREHAGQSPPPPLGPPSAAADGDALNSRVHVPSPPTRTVGRDRDLERLRSVVEAGRLVTVVGAGGVGKTRVANELARSVGAGMRDGAALVSLGPLATAEHVAPAIARSLDISPAPGESVPEALARVLSSRELLLVLDNFEHVLAAASLVAELVSAADGLRVLATSREPLRLHAEQLFPLQPLAITADEGGSRVAPAVAMFVQAVKARDPEFAPAPGDLKAIADLCRRLDGLPLAIELAASRVGLIGVPELTERLGRDLDALGSGPRDAPHRQRTLTATLEWSHALLDPEEQRVLAALAAFAGPCSIDAAEDVTAATLEVLDSLLAKNLILPAPASPDGLRRIGMLETVRAFAPRLLHDRPDAAEIARRHCEHYLALADRIRPELERTGSQAVIAHLDADVDNLRAAFGWALSTSPEQALRFASATAHYWHLSRLSSEAENWLGSALEKAGAAAPLELRAEALQLYALNLAKADTFSRAELAARESEELYRSIGDLRGRARSLNALAHVLTFANRPKEAYPYASEAVRLAEVSGDEQARAWALASHAMAAPSSQEAIQLGRLAIAAHARAGNQRETAGVQTSLAYATLVNGDDASAEAFSRDALETARAYGDPYTLALAHGNAGLSALFGGHTTAAQRAFFEELRLSAAAASEGAYARLLFEAIDGLAAVAAAERRDRMAAMLAGAAEAITRERHDPQLARRIDERFLAPARRRLGKRAWEAARAEGARLDRTAAIEAAFGSVELRAVS